MYVLVQCLKAFFCVNDAFHRIFTLMQRCMNICKQMACAREPLASSRAKREKPVDAREMNFFFLPGVSTFLSNFSFPSISVLSCMPVARGAMAKREEAALTPFLS